jgi:hypothetical protein
VAGAGVRVPTQISKVKPRKLENIKFKKTGEVLREKRNKEKRKKCGEVQQREKKEKNLYSKEKGKKIKNLYLGNMQSCYVDKSLNKQEKNMKYL